MEQALEALRAFTASAAERETGVSLLTDVALHVSVTPPAAHDEFLHEQALGFLFADEAKAVRQLQQKCEEGQRLATEIYCSRSCARAMPVVSSEMGSAQQARLYSTVFTVLQPQVAKLKLLSDFCAQTVVLLSDNIQRITVHENTTRVIPDILVDALLGLLDVLMQLNQLHDSKSSLRNDFSVFKRAFTHVREDVEGAEQIKKEIQRLQEFVGQSSQSKSSIWDSLRHNLTNVKRFDQVVFFLVKRAVWHFEHGICVASDEKFKYIRVLPCMLSVLEEDGSIGKKSSFQGPERKTIDAALKILARFPVVPLFAELNMKPVVSLRSLKTEPVGTATTKQQDKSFDLISVSASMKVVCQEYIVRLLRLTNMLVQGRISSSDNDEIAQLYSVVLEGLLLLTSWKCSVLLFVSNKYQNPNSNEKLRDFNAANASLFFEYERVTKYNYSAAELTAMAELISCIKSMSQALQQIQAQLVPFIRRHVYNALQIFVQRTMVPILHRADKRKIVCAKILHDLRLVCGDWMDSATVLNDFKKKRKERVLPGLNERVASPTLCQIQMVRTLLDSICAKRSMGDLNAKYPSASSLFSLKKDLNSGDIEVMQHFYRDSSVFPAMLEFDNTLSELADFSSLWFRELYLEICKCPQFPVESSLPWLLVDNCLQNVPIVGAQALLSVLDVYNDTANRCLYDWRQQFLFDEVETEGDLRFEQFVISLSSQVYAHYKRTAVRYLLQERDPPERRHKKSPSEASDNEKLYECVLKKTCVSVVGKQHNVSSLIGRHVHSKFSKDLAKWMCRMEASDASSIIEHFIKLQTLSRVHAMISIPLQMDRFDDMKQQVTKELFSLESSVAKISRVYTYVNRIVLHGLCHCFGVSVFSRQFVPIALPDVLASLSGNQSETMRENVARNMNSGASVEYLDSFESATGPEDQGIFGLSHVEALVTMLSHVQALELANDCVAFIQAKIEDVLDMCIEALGSAIPPFRLPRFMYRTEGCFGYFEGKFKYLFDSEELEAHIFHCLREIGNALFFLLMLNDVVDVRLLADDSNSTLPQSPKPQAHLFALALERIHQALQGSGITEEWNASVASHPEQTDNPSCFYRVWIALEFASCNSNNGKLAPRRQFGDGVEFAGCTLLHLLNQRPLYELWNASQHVLNVFEHEQTKAQANKATKGSHKAGGSGPGSPVSANQLVGALDKEMIKKAEAFTAQAIAMRKTTYHIFHILETARPNPSSETPLATAFVPPAFVFAPNNERQPQKQPPSADSQQTNKAMGWNEV